MKNDKLHNIKSTGYKTPDNYFENFEVTLLEQLKENKLIKDIDTSGFSVPDAYFDTVETNIITKLSETNKPVIPFKRSSKLYYISGIAASFVLFFGLVFSQQKAVDIEAIDTVAIENYLYQEDYSNDELASLFQTSEISDTDFIDVNISEETLNQYLESIDTEDFILD